MKVSTLSKAELSHRLRDSGLWLKTGSFVTCLHSPIHYVADGIHLLYSDYTLANDEKFADFHIRLEQPPTLRRWFKPQALFLFDDDSTFKPLPLDQAFPMFEWGLNWCVANHANSYLIIHAAVIEKNGHAAILPAPPGSGKSTLCAALVNRGWRLLSDELTLIRICDGLIEPLPRPVSLKNASIDVIKAYAPDAIFSPSVADTIKGTVAHMKPPVASIERGAETARPGWVIFPQYRANADTSLTPLPQSRAFMRMADNAFNYSVLGLQGFQTLTGLIDASLCYDFTYSVLDEAIETFNALTLPKTAQ